MAATCSLRQICLCLLFYVVSATTSTDYVQLIRNKALNEKWSTASHEFDDLLWPQRLPVIQFLKDTVANQSQLQLSPACTKSLAVVARGFEQRKFWSYKRKLIKTRYEQLALKQLTMSTLCEVLDSSARGQSGFTRGYLTDLGDFGNCLSIKVNEPDDSFRGQYCLVSIHFPAVEKPANNWLGFARKLDVSGTDMKNTVYEYYGNHSELFSYATFTLAVCMPSTCSRDDLNSVLQNRECFAHPLRELFMMINY